MFVFTVLINFKTAKCFLAVFWVMLGFWLRNVNIWIQTDPWFRYSWRHGYSSAWMANGTNRHPSTSASIQEVRTTGTITRRCSRTVEVLLEMSPFHCRTEWVGSWGWSWTSPASGCYSVKCTLTLVSTPFGVNAQVFGYKFRFCCSWFSFSRISNVHIRR